jgi:hypothetical protein
MIKSNVRFTMLVNYELTREEIKEIDTILAAIANLWGTSTQESFAVSIERNSYLIAQRMSSFLVLSVCCFLFLICD